MSFRGMLGIVVALGALSSSVRAEEALSGTVNAIAGFEGVVALSDRDRTRQIVAVGMADHEAMRPHRTDEVWLWASVTKQVAAVLVMQEVAGGRMALDAPVGDYLPSAKRSPAGVVTLRQLLRHTSGLSNPNDDLAPGTQTPRYLTRTGAGVGDGPEAKALCLGPLKRPPGSGFEYNNCDYLTLGAALQATTGKTFAALADERIARPLGLKSMRLAPNRLLGRTDVTGYPSPGARAPAINLAAFGASAALTGTAEDLLAFDRALMGHKLLSPGGRDILWEGDPALGYVALGAWSFSAPLKGCAGAVRLIERRGEAAGVQVRNVIAPDLGLALAVFTNNEALDFGEVWQGRGATYDLLSAAFCQNASQSLATAG